jgi:ABC-type branched-subunit amino acid transport system ATPase component
MLTKISLQNLRCFKEFTLENMTPLTLISGRNNVGKTTLLEGIFLLFAYRSAELFFKINAIRGIPAVIPSPQGYLLGLEPPSLWETLFPDMDMTLGLRISAEDDAGNASVVCLEKDAQVSVAQFENKNNAQNMLQPVPGSYVLNLSYENNGDRERGRFILTANGLALNFDAPPHLPTPPFASYIGPNVLFSQPQQLVDWLSKVDLDDKKQQIVEALRLLDKEIIDVFVVTKHGVADSYIRRNTSKPRSVRTLGDGINKLLSYLLAMIANPDGIFLLDEIETGFHYSFYPQLWELISTVAKETNSQVVATTHSYECISAAVEGTKKVDSSLLTYVRLGGEDSIVPYYFSGDNLAFALQNEMEVR